MKVDEKQYEFRIEAVAEMILAGLSRYHIINAIRTNDKYNWDVSDRQIDNYIKDARASIVKSTKDSSKETEVSKAIRRYEMLHAKALNAKDFRTCALINEKLTKLLGIAEPEKDNNTDTKLIIELVGVNGKDTDSK